ncbi:D-2-hydroxyacid dehydrogenase [Halorhodospira halochloris]|uniref:D-3-phosphoglycerate dehydrogenase n=1 Tax=Halorhodospira halochloris TaxID=1052 RepID=A0A0X8XCP6_HALHR|nr:D-2-hydroxyacid dehydrogenase [Halorhodospira halochloris]MBK1652191.1 hydroxyacid dehydrogenase [Halorhodospira halochloris]MCG5531231.1 D-2-hydroxyacid dehydrogenase [Halorhodospira halochloris]MCG5547798.1 D-2-hydroxyacid dehydrogenase [Halorhodospira halochloris]BAU58389.1 D-3-phosphoglycerate dehydrogenase [Halorhodospira halochloris]
MASSELPVIALLTAPEEAPPPGLERLDGRAIINHATSREGLIAAISDADILLVTDFRTRIVAEAWPYAKRLQWVHATSAGVDALLFPELIESPIPVTNARGIFDRAIAETVLGMVLMFAKDFRTTIALQQRHEWRHRETQRIQDKHVLVFGAGSIGRQIARMLTAAGMHVEGIASRERSEDQDFAAIHGPEAFYEQLGQADYVVIAAPLTESTRGLFDVKAFKSMANNAKLINIGRGPIVVTQDLIIALRNGDIAAAALDVFEEEPLPSDHPLWEMSNVFISHHMAGDFIGWRSALIHQFADNFERWQAGSALRNIVDKKRGYVPPEGS